MGAKYDATYVVPAPTATGAAKSTCCHPVAVSSANVAVANRVPAAVHSEPVWLPVFPLPL